jgi:hypothetical protein
MQVCRELKMTVTEGMNMSVLELKMWGAFFKMENEREKQAIKKAQAKR